jgi:RNA polymerase sigma factor (sigma-70 family)
VNAAGAKTAGCEAATRYHAPAITVPIESPEPREVADLAKRAARGDLDAFATLYSRLAPRLHVWARHKLTRHLQRECEPEDLMQETWRRAHGALAHYDSALGHFDHWFFGVAKNVLLSFLRQAGRDATLQISEGRTSHEQQLAEAQDPITSLTKCVARDDDMRKLADLIATLPPDEQELIVLCGLERASAADAAKRLGSNAETVTKRWQRLRERLRHNAKFARLFES